MARAAVDAEEAFNDALDAASGAEADTLQVDKIKARARNGTGKDARVRVHGQAKGSPKERTWKRQRARAREFCSSQKCRVKFSLTNFEPSNDAYKNKVLNIETALGQSVSADKLFQGLNSQKILRRMSRALENCPVASRFSWNKRRQVKLQVPLFYMRQLPSGQLGSCIPESRLFHIDDLCCVFRRRQKGGSRFCGSGLYATDRRLGP